IIYIHVPAAFLALAGYYVMAVAGAVGLVWKMKLSYMVMKAAAPLGAALTLVSLVTGALWGKPTWGTYWVWDARITSMLVLFFLYLGVIALHHAYSNGEAASKAAAVLALVGTANIPIIYKSVDWWYTLHQPATIKLTEAPSMHPDMFQPLVVMIGGFYCLYALVLILATRVEVLHRERRTRWVRDLVMGGRTDGRTPPGWQPGRLPCHGWARRPYLAVLRHHPAGARLAGGDAPDPRPEGAGRDPPPAPRHRHFRHRGEHRLMHPIRRQRLIAVVFIVILATAAVGLLTYALRQNINLFYTPSQIVAGEAPEGTRIRVGGMVVAGSVTRVPDSLDTVFKVTDGAGRWRLPTPVSCRTCSPRTRRR